MSEMVLMSESNQQIEQVRTTLNAELLSVYEEHHKMQAKAENLTERLSVAEKGSHKCVSRLRNLLASLNSYIEGREVSYEFKKSVGLVQSAVAYKGMCLLCNGCCSNLILPCFDRQKSG